ncbi:MAG: hypothetical protein IKL21_05205 [Clostridia bacterium]|nr:hypothetical protein [Clostridia bacterium]
MALKDILNKIIGKSNSNCNNSPIPFESDAFPVLDIKSEELSSYKKIPITELSALGAVFSQLPEQARTIVSTASKTMATDKPLYIGINPKNISGFLAEKDGVTVGNIMQINPQGKHVIKGRMGYKKIDNIPMIETTTTTLPIDPMLIVVAVALNSIEKKLGYIQTSVEDILQFLKQEKQASQRGNLNMLSEILEDYKSNRDCDNDTFCISRINTILSIKTAAYQDIEFYQQQLDTELQNKTTFHNVKDAQNTLNSVSYHLAEYQLACYIFAFSTFLDILLRKNFDATTLETTISKMLVMIKRYESLYLKCHSQISNYQHSAFESKILSGVGNAAKDLGKAMENIPLLKETSANKMLVSIGDSIEKHNQDTIERKLQKYETLKENRMLPFVENLQSLNSIYNNKRSMITDGENLYILESSDKV